jgi:hypothetical protein
MTHAEYMRHWRAADPERARAISRKAGAKWRANPDNHEKERERIKQYELDNLEKTRARKLKFQKEKYAAMTSEQRKKYNQDAYARNAENRRQQARDKRAADRLLVLTHYSDGFSYCACCKIAYFQFLTLDHIDGSGRAHRRQLGNNTSSHSTISWIIKNNFPPGFRVLCFNCNCHAAQCDNNQCDCPFDFNRLDNE